MQQANASTSKVLLLIDCFFPLERIFLLGEMPKLSSIRQQLKSLEMIKRIVEGGRVWLNGQ